LNRKPGYIDILLILTSGVGYYCIQNLFSRENILLVLPIYTAIFGAYLYWSFGRKLSFPLLVLIGLVFRLCVITGPPNWSDDYFRFYWDAQMTTNGINPYSFTPTELQEAHPKVFERHASVFEQLNSPDYYSVYPPALQAVFALSASLSRSLDGFVRCTQILIVLSELLAVLLMASLLALIEKAKELSALYFLNPLVIVELSGNLHNEVFMVLCSVAALWLLYKKQYWLSAIALAIAVACKLYPLLLAPIFLMRSGKSWLTYGLSFGLALALLFLPFIGVEEWAHIKQSIDLYYQKFEFNGGLYFLLRKMISGITEYNPIAYLGPSLGFLSVVLIVNLYRIGLFKPTKNDVFRLISLTILFFYTTSTTVHPWYLSLMIAMSVFTKERFAVFWSFAIVFTYASYASTPYRENYLIVAIEWLALLTFILWETFSGLKSPSHERSE